MPFPLNATELNWWEGGAHVDCLMVLWWVVCVGSAFNWGLQNGTRVAPLSRVQRCPTLTFCTFFTLIIFSSFDELKLHKRLFLSDSPLLVLYWGREMK